MDYIHVSVNLKGRHHQLPNAVVILLDNNPR